VAARRQHLLNALFGLGHAFEFLDDLGDFAAQRATGLARLKHLGIRESMQTEFHLGPRNEARARPDQQNGRQNRFQKRNPQHQGRCSVEWFIQNYPPRRLVSSPDRRDYTGCRSRGSWVAFHFSRVIHLS
jgi:hypothetical protein